jgi:hypothetical protein
MVPFHLVALLIGALAAPDAEPSGQARELSALPVTASVGMPGVTGAVGGMADSAGIAVLVHQGGAPQPLEPSQIRRIFLLRQRFWSDGTPVSPVNLPAASPLREEFSRLVLGQSTRELAEYWKDLYFHGTQPPAVLDSEEAVLLYVSRTQGGIGYVSLAFLGEVTLPPDVWIARVWTEGG